MTKTAAALGLALSIAACGGSIAAVDADAGAGSSGGSGGSAGGSSGSSGTSGTSGGTSSDGGPASSSGASGGTSGSSGSSGASGGSSSGAPPPPPASLTCGMSSCNTASQDCCDSRAGLGCVAKGTCMGATLTCTSAGDCPPGDVCCLGGFGPGGPPTSSCQMRCGGGGGPGGGGQQLCASDAECGMRHCFKDSSGLGICAFL